MTLRLDNDILALRGTEAPPDYDYTHGMHLAVVTESAPGWGRLLPGRDGLRTRIGIGQRIYTPRRDAPEPLPGERPYAAWLYASAAAVVAEPGRERSLSVELGITGPPALGEPVQNGVHRLTGSERQVGWDHQLGLEPGIILRYEDVRRFAYGRLRIAPGWAVTAGNVRTGAEAGARARLGRASGRGAFATAGARGEWVLRDLFLDGNSFRNNSLAEKLPFVSEGRAGVGYGFRGGSVAYEFVVRTREYRAQPAPHRYGSLVLTLSRSS